MASRRVHLPKHGPDGTFVVFHPRDVLRKRHERHLRCNFGAPNIPAVPLPLDTTNNQQVSAPMDDNDSEGCCELAQACHVDNIWTYAKGKGTESFFDDAKISTQYLAASGGDNGLDETLLLDKCWKPGLAGVAAATYTDSVNIDITNNALVLYAMQQFYHVCMEWSVPDEFIKTFATNVLFSAAGIPDDQNGHATPLSGADAQGNIYLWTWGTYCRVSQTFINSVQPDGFVVFSARQFNAEGYDADGRHITQQAQVWVAYGGNPIPAEVINSFPPINPAPTPEPVPTPAPVPNPVPVPTPVPPTPPAPPVPPPSPTPAPAPPTPSQVTFSITIPSQKVIFDSGLHLGVTAHVPEQTVTGTVTIPLSQGNSPFSDSLLVAAAIGGIRNVSGYGIKVDDLQNLTRDELEAWGYEALEAAKNRGVFPRVPEKKK